MTIIAQDSKIVYGVISPVSVDVINGQDWLASDRIWRIPATLCTLITGHFKKMSPNRS